MNGLKKYQLKLFIVLALGAGSSYILPAVAQDDVLVDASADISTEMPVEMPVEMPAEMPPVEMPPFSEPASRAPVTAEARLVLSLSQRQVSLFRGETLIDSYPVAVGAAETLTPQGEFTVSQMVVEPLWQSPWTGVLHEPGADSALGLRWIGFTTTSAGSFGFHGTPTVNSIGHAVSNGCVRMYNEDVVALFEQVEIGTPVIVTP